MSDFVPATGVMRLNPATSRYEAYTIDGRFLVSVERTLWAKVANPINAAEPHGGVMGAFACGPEVWKARHDKHPDLDIVVTATESNLAQVPAQV